VGLAGHQGNGGTSPLTVPTECVEYGGDGQVGSENSKNYAQNSGGGDNCGDQ
jgi:hypothetical protein